VRLVILVGVGARRRCVFTLNCLGGFCDHTEDLNIVLGVLGFAVFVVVLRG
tara:strand:+ start:349 stop:501 length:153 start_codon:yes stop_codon:yes gene_type:complete